ncbi:MAG: DNA topoisomerase VI subunit B [bacterium]|nr:DNA topoisomerase VI subunit B [bacterium]
MSDRQQSFGFQAAARSSSAAASGGRAAKGVKRKKSAGKSAKRKPTQGRAPAKKHARKSSSETQTSGEALARKQREISVSEFFAKNRHLLGFDNPSKALLTTIKELVDNSLDAADEARIPADVEIRIDQLAEDRFRVTCTDNGPGIPAKNIPLVFGKLLYGSKFHRLKMSRGQQGIGVSAAGMYGLLTTGHPLKVISRTGKKKDAMRFVIAIDTQKNQAAIKKEEIVDWEAPHGTSVEIELEAAYRKGQHSVDNYIRQISLANPHAKLTYLPPGRDKDEECIVYDRVTKDLPPETAEIQPHPYGVELGVLMQFLRESKSRNLTGFLASEFSRVSSRTAQEICKNAGIKPTRKPREMNRNEAESLHKGIGKTKIMSPPTDCIAPIGEDLLQKALDSIHPGEFSTAITRRPAVYRGNPFLIEAALVYGGNLSGDDQALCYRYANRVPLQYQQGACAINRAVTTTDWKKYGLQQPRGGLPVGPMVVMVHIASVWVPFTSESKEAIAHYPEIIKEIKLALQDCGRRLSTHVRRRRREADELKKRSYIQKYIPHVALALQEILGFDDKVRENTVATLTDVLEKSRKL